MSNQQPLWRAGQTIADLYEVREINTEGGMAIAYFVWHTAWRLELVIKSPRPELLAEQSARDQFTHEAETWVNLGLHPNIVTAYYVRQIEEFPRIIIEKMNGGSLKQWMAASKVKDLATALDIAIQIASGLAYAQKHQPGFVHRDIKPANVLMTPYGEAKVTDFGLVGAVGARVGTPAYMSPEVWTDPANVTPAADLYSFGVMLYEILTGRRPFERGGEGASLGEIRGGRGVEGSVGGLRELELDAPVEQSQLSIGERRDIERMSDRSVGEMTALTNLRAISEDDLAFYFMAHTKGTPEAPSRFNATIGEELDGLCMSLLEKEANTRPTSAEEVTERLKAIHEQHVGHSYPRAAPNEAELVADGLNNRGLSFLDLGKDAEAKASWLSALDADSHHPEATYNMGVLEWQRAQITDDTLVRRLERVLTAHGERWQTALILALAHLERSDTDSAVSLLEIASQQAPDDIDVQAALKLARSDEITNSRCLRVFEGHESYVNSVCISADGRLALSGSSDQTLRLWDVSEGHCLRILTGATAAVTSVSLSADGRYALSGDCDGSIRHWDLRRGQCREFSERLDAELNSVCLSADGSLALSGSKNGGALLWDVATGKCITSAGWYEDQVSSVCLSADGRLALSGSYDGTIQLYDVVAGKRLRRFGESSAGQYSPFGLSMYRVYAVDLSADGRYALSGHFDGKLKLWDATSGDCVRVFKGHKDAVHSVCLSNDNSRALSGGEDKMVRVWDVATGRCIRTLEGHTTRVGSVCMDADGILALSSGGWEDPPRLWQLPGKSPNVCSMRLSRLWSYAQTSEFADLSQRLLNGAKNALDERRFAEALDMARQARQVVGHERAESSMATWAELSLFCPKVSYQAAWFVRDWRKSERLSSISSICLDAGGKVALTGGCIGFVNVPALELWDIATGERLRSFEGHQNEVASVYLSADGCKALSGSDDKTMKLWDVSTGECLQTFGGDGGDVRGVALSADGRWAFSADGSLQLWEVETGRHLRTFDTGKSLATSLCLSADGRFALAGSWDGNVRLFDIATGARLRLFHWYEHEVVSICLTPDGRLALSAYYGDNRLLLWDVATGEWLKILEGHTGASGLYGVCMSADGRWALSSGWDSTLRLWNLETGQCVRVFEEFKGQLTGDKAICMSADGHWAISSDKLWELDWELEAREEADWDAGALPYLNNFLSLHTPYAGALPQDREPSEGEIQFALTRRGKPSWTERDFEELIQQLRYAGYGWLRPEAVRKKLEEMAAQ